MSRRVFSRGRVIGGTASLASVCEFVEFTFIGIFKADDTPKTCRFSTPPPIAQEKEISHKKAQKAQDSFCEFCASLWLISLGGQQSATTVFTCSPAAKTFQFFQIKRLVFGIASESAMDRVTRITDSDFADEKIDAEIDQCRRSQCGHG